MIVFELQCGALHRFEGWFSSADEFEGQRAAGQVNCPVCGDRGIDRVPAARIRRGREAPPAAAATKPQPQPRRLTPELFSAFVDHALANSEDVGERFPEEARSIHYGESEKRAVRGVASPQETAELLDEGIPVMPLPVPVKKDWH